MLNFNADYKAFVNFAQSQAIQGGDENAVAHADVQHQTRGSKSVQKRQVSVIKAGEGGTAKDKAFALLRSDKAKAANAFTRSCFERAIADVFGGREKIPANVREQMTNFGTDKPLTARRILLIANEISVLQANAPTRGDDIAAVRGRFANVTAETQTKLSASLVKTGAKGFVGESVRALIDQVAKLHRAPIEALLRNENGDEFRDVTDRLLLHTENKVRLDTARILVANGMTDAAKEFLGAAEFDSLIGPDAEMLQTLVDVENPDPELADLKDRRVDDPGQKLAEMGAPRAKSQKLLGAVLEKLAALRTDGGKGGEVFCKVGNSMGQYCRANLAQAIREAVGEEGVQVVNVSRQTNNAANLVLSVLSDEIRSFKNVLGMYGDRFADDLETALNAISSKSRDLFDSETRDVRVTHRQVLNYVRMNIARTLVAHGRDDLACAYLGKRNYLNSGICEEAVVLRKSDRGILDRFLKHDWDSMCTDKSAFSKLERPYGGEERVFFQFLTSETIYENEHLPALQVAVPKSVAVIAKGDDKNLVAVPPADPQDARPCAEGDVQTIQHEEILKAVPYLSAKFGTNDGQSVSGDLWYALKNMEENCASVLKADALKPGVTVAEIRNACKLNVARFLISRGLEDAACAYLGKDVYLQSGLTRHAPLYTVLGRNDGGRISGSLMFSQFIAKQNECVNPNRRPKAGEGPAEGVDGRFLFKDTMPDGYRQDNMQLNETVVVKMGDGTILMDPATFNRQYDLTDVPFWPTDSQDTNVTRQEAPGVIARQGFEKGAGEAQIQKIVDTNADAVEDDDREDFERKFKDLQNDGLIDADATLDFTQGKRKIKALLDQAPTVMMSKFDKNHDSAEFVDMNALWAKANDCLQLLTPAKRVNASAEFKTIGAAYDAIHGRLVQELELLGVKDDLSRETVSGLRARFVATVKDKADALNGSRIDWKEWSDDEAVEKYHQLRLREFVELTNINPDNKSSDVLEDFIRRSFIDELRSMDVTGDFSALSLSELRTRLVDAAKAKMVQMEGKPIDWTNKSNLDVMKQYRTKKAEQLKPKAQAKTTTNRTAQGGRPAGTANTYKGKPRMMRNGRPVNSGKRGE